MAVAFNYAAWSARYPVLAASVTEATALAYFAEACVYCDNTDTSPVEDEAKRALLLGMAVAHIATLEARDAEMNGRVASATQGSITIQTQADYPPGTVQWWQQTRPGAAFWAASQQYRLVHYIPGPIRDFEPWRWR